MGKQKQRTSRKSSGMGRVRRCNAERRHLESKKRRWARYVEEINAGDRKGSVARWDASGIDRRLNQLRELIKKGSTTK